MSSMLSPSATSYVNCSPSFVTNVIFSSSPGFGLCKCPWKDGFEYEIWRSWICLKGVEGFLEETEAVAINFMEGKSNRSLGSMDLDEDTNMLALSVDNVKDCKKFDFDLLKIGKTWKDEKKILDVKIM